VRDTSLYETSFAAFNAGDLETLFDLYTEDCIWDVSRFHGGIAADLADVYRGHEGLSRFVENFAALIEPWGGARAEFGRALELDDGRFWIEGRMRFGSPGGATELIEPFVQLVGTREGKIATVVVYWKADEARRAAELERMPAS
jgi:ketosteroid isomerase-like protein